MQQLFRIRPVHWALYASIYIAGLAAVITGLRFEGATDDAKKLLIIGFAAFVIFLFYAFLSFLQRTWGLPYPMFAIFFVSNAALLAVEFGIIPTRFYKQALTDNTFFIFSPTGILTLIIASATVFFLYWVFSTILGWLFRVHFRTIFSKTRNAIKENLSFIICIGAIALFFIALLGFINTQQGILLLLGLFIIPFAVYAITIIADKNSFIAVTLLVALFAITYGWLLYKSVNDAETGKKSELHYSIVFLSRHMFIAHLIAWALYMKLLGIVFKFVPWNPFQI